MITQHRQEWRPEQQCSHDMQLQVEPLRELGWGSSGPVLLARLSGEGLVALKRVSLRSTEHLVLTRLSHPSIAQLRGSFVQDMAHRYLLLEYFVGMELFTLINEGPIKDELMLIIIRQLISVLCYLHDDAHLVHGDLKPENILVEPVTGIVKLIDFGMARSADRLCTGLWGSLEYAPPEMHTMQPYCPKRAEMWSLGIVLYAMLHRCLPGDNQGSEQREDHVLMPIIRSLTSADPTRRPTCQELISIIDKLDEN